MKLRTLALAAMATALLTGAANARDQIRIVGSSTVFPFATAVAENFGKKTSFKTPVVESTGTGGGMKLFCAGIGDGHADITNASRRIKSSEFKKCSAKGIRITEVKIGFDGIVLANAKSAKRLTLSNAQIFLALANKVPVNGKLVDNPYKKWSDITPSLPNKKIEVLGPPPTSGTRDAFVEIAMEGGCKKVAGARALGLTEKKCHQIREDGAWIDAGENDNLIVQKLETNPNAVGVFGYSFLDQNADKIQGAIVDGSEPTFENIASGKYGVSRSLFFYVKQQHVGTVPGIREFVKEFTSEDAWGEDGYLVDKGLIPLPASERKVIAISARNLDALTM
ncbi:MAG: PstS family phosphate ABC transporter substrate-binding protein [Rhodospirillales bacterium]|nr:PstS family phosphate ABC transporter substrate-binding protein [Rhodospirillales bacterium]